MTSHSGVEAPVAVVTVQTPSPPAVVHQNSPPEAAPKTAIPKNLITTTWKNPLLAQFAWHKTSFGLFINKMQ